MLTSRLCQVLQENYAINTTFLDKQKLFDGLVKRASAMDLTYWKSKSSEIGWNACAVNMIPTGWWYLFWFRGPIRRIVLTARAAATRTSAGCCGGRRAEARPPSATRRTLTATRRETAATTYSPRPLPSVPKSTSHRPFESWLSSVAFSYSNLGTLSSGPFSLLVYPSFV